MKVDSEEFRRFLTHAKRNTYAAGAPPSGSSRKGSKDLEFTEGDLRYLDSYFGGKDFIGEEAVYFGEEALWGMNYYGRSLEDADTDGSSMGLILHGALMQVPLEAPYRGPRHFASGDCVYRCSWEGNIEAFRGEEEIRRGDLVIYSLLFHGGLIR